jgi:hypothetical protein
LGTLEWVASETCGPSLSSAVAGAIEGTSQFQIIDSVHRIGAIRFVGVGVGVGAVTIIGIIADCIACRVEGNFERR